MSSRKRTQFTEEQKKELESAFAKGLTSVCAKNTQAIEDLAKQLDCSTQVVKVCHSNSHSNDTTRDEICSTELATQACQVDMVYLFTGLDYRT